MEVPAPESSKSLEKASSSLHFMAIMSGVSFVKCLLTSAPALINAFEISWYPLRQAIARGVSEENSQAGFPVPSLQHEMLAGLSHLCSLTSALLSMQN